MFVGIDKGMREKQATRRTRNVMPPLPPILIRKIVIFSPLIFLPPFYFFSFLLDKKRGREPTNYGRRDACERRRRPAQRSSGKRACGEEGALEQRALASESERGERIRSTAHVSSKF